MNTKQFFSFTYKFSAAIMVVMLALATLPVKSAQAASTGFTSPGSRASTTWATPANARI